MALSSHKIRHPRLVSGGLQFPGIAAVGKDPLDEGVEAARAQQQTLGAVPVLHVGAMHLDTQEPPIGVGQNVPLAAMDFLRSIEAFESPFGPRCGPTGCR